MVLSQDNLIFEHVPTKPFPSDHAAVSAAIAMATMRWGIKNNEKKYIYISYIFWAFCLIMSVSRVAAWVHWPTDIIAGILVWVIVPVILYSDKIYEWIRRNIFIPIIHLEKWIFKKLFGIDQK